jgi:MobA-like NTP transferase domain
VQALVARECRGTVAYTHHLLQTLPCLEAHHSPTSGAIQDVRVLTAAGRRCWEAAGAFAGVALPRCQRYNVVRVTYVLQSLCTKLKFTRHASHHPRRRKRAAYAPFDTDGCHKTLLPVNGVTLIGSLLATLESAGIRKVLIVTGYDAERVEQHVRERFDHLALRFVHNEQYEVTNNIVSLAIAFEHLTLEEDLLLIEADLVISFEVLG